jgi:hypothetical protein
MTRTSQRCARALWSAVACPTLCCPFSAAVATAPGLLAFRRPSRGSVRQESCSSVVTGALSTLQGVLLTIRSIAVPLVGPSVIPDCFRDGSFS